MFLFKNQLSQNCAYVQENIMTIFLEKLKKRLKSVKIGRADGKEIDIAYPTKGSVSRFNELLQNAEAQGYEIFRSSNDYLSWSPTLLVGYGTPIKVNAEDEDVTANFATVIPFRSIDEAVALANNLEQGLGVSLWSENLRVVNEVTRKLAV